VKQKRVKICVDCQLLTVGFLLSTLHPLCFVSNISRPFVNCTLFLAQVNGWRATSLGGSPMIQNSSFSGNKVSRCLPKCLLIEPKDLFIKTLRGLGVTGRNSSSRNQEILNEILMFHGFSILCVLFYFITPYSLVGKYSHFMRRKLILEVIKTKEEQ